MTDLVERYIHQVGRYLPRKERSEIEAELRSLIQDQLDDRFKENPSENEVATLLAELGDPRHMAMSYAGEQYLIGPELYPTMMMVLRHGWLLVPTIVLFLNIFGTLIESDTATIVNLFINPVLGALQATFTFTAIVILIFTILQHSGMTFPKSGATFDPSELPQIDDPSNVDRVEVAFGVALGTFVCLLFLYFLSVGGLTLRFNLSDPGKVINAPPLWMLMLIIVVMGQIIMNLIALGRKRWNAGLWLGQTALEIVGAVCMYFAVTKPLFESIISTNPDLAEVIFVKRGPEMLVIGYSVITLFSKSITMIKLLNYMPSDMSRIINISEATSSQTTIHPNAAAEQNSK